MLNITNEDNMDLMARYSDKYFDLAIVDPPYGIGAGNKTFMNGTGRKSKNYFKFKKDNWDIKPNKKYFDELFRISRNQIIWGGNYFIDNLYPSRCFIFWDKTVHGYSYADGELAWTSFDKPARYFRFCNHGGTCAPIDDKEKIHPTQKPVALYKWLLKNYAKDGDKVLDTHLGSMSIAIAIHQVNTEMGMNLTLIGCELDEEYFCAGLERVQNFTKQNSLFDKFSPQTPPNTS